MWLEEIYFQIDHNEFSSNVFIIFTHQVLYIMYILHIQVGKAPGTKQSIINRPSLNNLYTKRDALITL